MMNSKSMWWWSFDRVFVDTGLAYWPMHACLWVFAKLMICLGVFAVVTPLTTLRPARHRPTAGTAMIMSSLDWPVMHSQVHPTPTGNTHSWLAESHTSWLTERSQFVYWELIGQKVRSCLVQWELIGSDVTSWLVKKDHKLYYGSWLALKVRSCLYRMNLLASISQKP